MVVAKRISICYTIDSINKGCLRMRKRLLSALLALAAVMTMIPAAFAASDLDGH